MKKLFSLAALMLAVVCLFASCEHTHYYAEWETIKQPTCSENGEKVRYCTCGEKQSEIVLATGHRYVDGVCENCGDENSSDTPVLPDNPACKHTEVEILAAVEPTCTETGLTEGSKCSACGEILAARTVVEALGHIEVVDDAVEATCTSTGLTKGKHCSACGEVLVAQTVVDALDHTEVIDAAVDATCTATGLTEGKHCDVCQEVLVAQTETAKIPHTYDDKYDESCNNCGFVRDAECAHTNVTILPAKDATCTESGLTEGKVCAKCEEIIVAQNVINALGHTEVVDKAVEPTCTETGLTEGKHCSVCKETLLAQTTVPVNDHNFENQVCLICGAKYYSKGLEYAPFDNDTCYVSGIGVCTDTDIIIPEISPDGIKVTGIGASAFHDCSFITSITLPASIESLGNDAFSMCEISKVYVTSLEHWLSISYEFYPLIGKVYDLYIGGEQLVDLVIPEGVEIVKDCAFYGCKSIETVNISDGVTSIDSCAFAGCINLKQVVFSTSLAEIKESAFLWGDSIDFYYMGNQYDWERITVADDFNDLTNCRTLYYSENRPAEKGNFWHYVDGAIEIWPEYVAPAYSVGLEYMSNGDGTCYVSGIGDCSDMHIIIPEVSPDGLKVVAIGDSAFFGCRGFESITIPNSVTRIGDSALSYCTSLKSVAISDSVTYIGKNAFYYSDNLTSVYIPAGVTYIGDSAFSYCWINNISVSEENQHYKDIDGNLYTKDGKKLLQYSIAKRETEFVIPDGVTHIGSEAFGYNSYITSVIIPESVTHIGNNAFAECYELVNFVIPPNVVEIGHGAFAYCKFTSCVIPDGVASIGSSTFMGCSALASIVIPESVTSIGEYAFYWCNALNDIYYTASEDLWNKIAIASFCNDSLSKANIHFNYGKPAYSVGLEYMSNGDGTCYVSDIGLCSDTDIIIPEISPDGLPVTGIGASAFYNCSNLTSVSIPDSVISIGGHAFYCCTGLCEILIPNGVTTIGYQAFGNCTGLSNIILPDSITSLGDRAFFNCTGITKITLPNRITAVSGELFMSCTGLTDITIPDAVTTIGIGAFWDCSSLVNVTIPKSVTVIDEMAFAGCTALTSIIIPDGVTSIGYQAFSGCSGLSEINIPDSVNTIGEYAFNGCFALTSAIINGNGTTQIGSNAFASCNKLSSLVIGDGVKTISDGAFIRCFSLTSVVIDDSVTHVGYQAFEYCSNISDVYYTGNESAWENINFESYNECLTDATIQFNYVLN